MGGHYHKLIVARPMSDLYLTDDGKDIHQSYTAPSPEGYVHPDLRYYGCSGAFFKQYEVGYNSYAEIAGYKPSEMGYLVLKVRDGSLASVEKVKI